MAIVDRDSVGRVSIMELSIGELIALSDILVAGSKAKETSYDELRKIEGIINGLCRQLKYFTVEMKFVSDEIEKHLKEYKSENIKK